MIQRWSIRARVLSLALVPAMLLGLVLAIYFINTRIADLRQQQTELGRALVEQLGAAAEYGVFTGNDAVLKRLTASVATEADVSAVTILDKSGRTLVRQTREPDRDKTPPLYRALADFMPGYETELRFEAPIIAGKVNLGEFDGLLSPDETSANESGTRQLGTAVIQLSAHHMAVRQAEVFAKGFAITLGGLLLILILATQVARRLTRPLRRMIATLNRFRDGDLRARVREDAGGELGSLQYGINAMADAVVRSREDMQNEIDKATLELRETLEAVEVKNVELDLARKRALDANRVKSEFLANMSHEIRTPMNAVLGFTDLLKNTDLDPTQREYARTIDESASTLLALLENVLDLSRIEAGRLHAERIPFELRHTLEEVVNGVADAAHESHLELIFRMEPDRPFGAIGDENKIRQILTNLLDNAIKFTERGFVRLAVQIDEDRTAGTATAHFHVQDTGPGIPDEFRDRLFEVFSQADTSITREHGGAGLGLALCRQLTRLMDGEISLETQPEQGTIFHVSIPLELQASFREPADEESPLRDVHIALYETSDEAAEALHHRLFSLGATVTRFRQLDELAQAFSNPRSGSGGPDLAVLSLNYVELRHPENLYTLWRGTTRPPQLVLANSRDKRVLRRIGRIVGAPCLPKQTSSIRLQSELEQLLGNEPAKPAPDARTGDTAHSSRPERPMSQGPEHADIVVVDDNRINRELAARHIRELGHDCRILESGRELITLLRSHCPQLVLLDIRMAGLSGQETLERIRTARLCPDTRFVALTAHASEDEMHDFLSQGFEDVVTKPFTRNDLENALSIGHSGSPESTGDKAPDPDESHSRAIPDDLDPEIRGMLSEDLPNARKRCLELMETRDWTELKNAVHDVHGTAAFCNLEPLRRTAREFEVTLDSGNPENIELRSREFFRDLDAIIYSLDSQ